MNLGTSVSRPTIATVVLVIVCMLLAIGLFVAGAMWRARVTRAATASPEGIFSTAAGTIAGGRRGSRAGNPRLTG
jgi:hypothetical protein